MHNTALFSVMHRDTRASAAGYASAYLHFMSQHIPAKKYLR